MKKIRVKVSSLPGGVQTNIRAGQQTISKFKELNKLSFDLTICIDYKLDGPGVFDPETPGKIYINPRQCLKSKSVHRKTCAMGYVNSYTIQDVIIHEFCHFLDQKYGILADYSTIFGKDRCRINNNCNSLNEEIAEILNIYIVNPMLLKMIDKKRWKFFRSMFKSPAPTSKVRFLEFWKAWSKDIQRNCARLWNIYVHRGRLYHAAGWV